MTILEFSWPSSTQTYINPEYIIFNKVMGMPTIVHFDLPADDPERAKKFYEK